MAKLFYRSYLCWLVLTILLAVSTTTLFAQKDSTARARDTTKHQTAASDSFFLLKSKGLIGRLAKSITTDTNAPNSNVLRIDKLYEKYTGRIIRDIEIRRVDFGVPINDTTRSFKNILTRAADALHHTTREYIIRNNLFFKEGDTLLPALLADNERQLRDQNYISDAKIIVKSVLGTRDSVDVIVLAKDVLSIGGSANISSLTKGELVAREDNFMGLGDRIQLSGFYDQARSTHFGAGAEYTARNISGSFADATLGFRTYTPTFNTGHKQESTIYASFLRPLVNPYMKWTYAFEAAAHNTSNYYFPDTTYENNYQYRYYNIDAWGGYNMSARQLNGDVRDDRLRTLVGLRFLHQAFQEVPTIYQHQYFYQYANLTGMLASISIFRQNFDKTQYVYGFGRNEDVPEGLDFSLTAGWTDKQNRTRPYMGLDMSYNYFTKKESYFNYTLRLGWYAYHKKYEDISILGNLEYFSKLKTLNSKWKQRTFINASITTQLNKVLNEPLLLESQYGLQEYQDIHLGGDHRVTVKAESVFFNNWSLFAFKFAPFVFGNGALLTPVAQPIVNTKLYGTVGAGLRSRNESLVFGTLEFRTYYFPGRNFNGDSFRFEFNTNVRFKYNTQFIRRPNFIMLN